VVALWPGAAAAIRYEVFIDVETEEDIYDLLITEQISEASFDALLLLHQTRVELNRADRQTLYRLPNLDYVEVDRILAFREQVTAIRSVDELAAAEVLSERVANSIRPFVVVRPPDLRLDRVDGFLRTQMRWTGRYDRLPPAAAVQARLRAVRNLDAGLVGALTRNRLRQPRWDPPRQALSVAPEGVRLEIPKAYIEWEDDRIEVIAGTYRVGFGQRLTFDVTDQVTPNGLFGDFELRRENELSLRCRRSPGELPVSPCPLRPTARVTPDFRWTNRLTGFGVGLKRLDAGPGWLQGYAWGSYQVQRVLATEMVVGTACRDPRRDDDPACAAPRVFVRDRDPRSPAPTVTHSSLPAALAEALAGANISYFWGARRHLGLTGYGAVPRWRIEGVELDFQEHAAKPFGGAFGAAGLDAAIGFRRQDFFAEVARSFDRQTGGGGGYAAIVRSVTTVDAGEIDVSARYYHWRYANPYARPTSAPDEHDGLRARDETGIRVRAVLDIGRRVALRTLFDGWRQLSSAGLRAAAFARVDLQVTTNWAWAFWIDCKSGSRKAAVATQVTYAPSSAANLSLQTHYRSYDASLSNARRQRDLAVVLNVTARPARIFRVRLRLRYDYEDLADNHRLPQTLWSYLDVGLTVRDKDLLRARYDVRAHLDERESTRLRAPNPEHWLWLEYVFRY
jgi:hypothetical protein